MSPRIKKYEIRCACLTNTCFRKFGLGLRWCLGEEVHRHLEHPDEPLMLTAVETAELDAYMALVFESEQKRKRSKKRKRLQRCHC